MASDSAFLPSGMAHHKTSSEFDFQSQSFQTLLENLGPPQSPEQEATLADSPELQNRFKSVSLADAASASHRVKLSAMIKAIDSSSSLNRCTRLPHAITVDTSLLSSVPSRLRSGTEPPAALLSIRDPGGQVVQRIVKTWDQIKEFDRRLRAEFTPTKPLARIPPRHLFLPDRGPIVPTHVDIRHDMLGAYFKSVLELGSSLLRPARRQLFLQILTEFITRDLATLSPFVASGGMVAFFLQRSRTRWWETRYATLNTNIIDVFSAPDGKHLYGYRLVPSCYIRINWSEDDGSADDERYSFSILSTENDELRLSAETREDMVKWVTAILNVIERGVTGSAYRGGYLSRDESSRRSPPCPLPYILAQPSASPKRRQPKSKNIVISAPTDPLTTLNMPSSIPSGMLNLPMVSDISNSQLSTLASIESPSSSMTRSSSTAISLTTREPTFGVSLNKLTHISPYHGLAIPTIVARCLDYLETERAGREEGIFRISAQKSLLAFLESEFDAKGDVNLHSIPEVDCNTVATLLKQYLRKLPQPVLGEWTRVQEAQVTQLDETQLVSLLQARVCQLATYEYNLLYVVTDYLRSVSIHQQCLEKRMDARNLSIIFSATLKLPQPVVYAIITEFNKVFGFRMGTVPVLSVDLPTNIALMQNQSLLT